MSLIGVSPLFLLIVATTALLAAFCFWNFSSARHEISSGRSVAQKYQLLKRLAVSSRGEVYEAKDRVLNRIVAIKKIKSAVVRNEEARQKLKEQVRTVASLSHPNLIDLYEIVEDEKSICLVLEFVQGRSLSSIMKKQKTIPLDTALRILKGVANAVDYAHTRQVLHGSLSSSHIMVSENGLVKVLGLSVNRQIEDLKKSFSHKRERSEMAIYSAPEDLEGHPAMSCDVYSLGVCFYEWINGTFPFQGAEAELLTQKREGRIIPISTRLHGEISKDLDKIFSQVLSPQPAKRFSLAENFVKAFEKVTRR